MTIQIQGRGPPSHPLFKTLAPKILSRNIEKRGGIKKKFNYKSKYSKNLSQKRDYNSQDPHLNLPLKIRKRTHKCPNNFAATQCSLF